MSVQFGRWNLDGKPVDPRYLEQTDAVLEAYGPDGEHSYTDKDVSILYHPFHTTKESRREVQPHICSCGAVITWDGRLDNRADLIRELGRPLAGESTDIVIVAAAYEQWSTRCFSKLVGDWALSIWDSNNRSLVLAKDPIGTRHLYYRFDVSEICWSTILDPLVRQAARTFALEEEYIAGWLSMFPATHLTPCVGVCSVPPSSFVCLGPGKHAVRKYWDFNPTSKIRYKTDAEYEEHFRAVFATAVQRRLRSDRPILAELSGGRDSSSIVCVADEIVARGAGGTPRLDTISYYDDSEPNWNERPYFTKVEEQRGRTGWHVDVRIQDQEDVNQSRSFCDRLVPAPGYDGRPSAAVGACLASQGNLVVLSGIGGDETMGGVPTPIPELQDSLLRGLFRKLAHQMKIWALEKRRPWLHLFLATARGFLPPKLVEVPQSLRPVPWLQAGFAERHWEALTGYPTRVKLFGSPPSFQHNVSTVDALRRQLAITSLPFDPPFEKRYPFLDRDLLEFTFAIPREQLIRPKQRRSLMRRSLASIVPAEILNKKGKAFVVRSPLRRISRDWASLIEMAQHLASSSLGIIDQVRFVDALQAARCGEAIRTVHLVRTINLEVWIRGLRTLGIVNPVATLRTSVT